MNDLGQMFETCSALYRSVFPDTGDAVLFADESLDIVLANPHAGELFQMAVSEMAISKFHVLIASSERTRFRNNLKRLAFEGSWAEEIQCINSEGLLFTVDMTVKKILWKGGPLYCVNMRDLSDYKMLRKQIRQEKANRREMYVTMRNLMKAFAREKRGTERYISYKIETLILPTLEKIKHEPSVNLRNTFLALMREQLTSLTKGFGVELDSRFLTLTRTEMKICRMIQAGQGGKEIAQKLGISFETVQTHRKNIRKKLGLRGQKVNLYTLLSGKSFFSSDLK